jgi:hypothetical protein
VRQVWYTRFERVLNNRTKNEIPRSHCLKKETSSTQKLQKQGVLSRHLHQPHEFGIVMSTIPKRKYKRSDIEANYRNETKTF